MVYRVPFQASKKHQSFLTDALGNVKSQNRLIQQFSFFLLYKLGLNKIAARWPAKAVA